MYDTTPSGAVGKVAVFCRVGDDSDAEDGSWTVDRARAGPMLVQLASLGRRVDMIELGAPRRHL